MPSADWETMTRHVLAGLLSSSRTPEEIDLDADLTRDLGLSSLNKVLLLTALCEDTGVGLSHFTEQDLARMTTPRQILDALIAYRGMVTS